jgi:hypothetical protein
VERSSQPETDERSTDSISEAWPTCDPDQIQVMLLGTYHMDNPGLDVVNVDADDVLAADRQAELQDLVERLEAWQPDRIAVERPHGNFESVNDLYGKYRSGEYAYDREETFPAPHPMRNGEDSECRSEVVQVGFRLADGLGHDHVAPIDEHPEEPDDNPFENREIDSARKTTVSLPDPEVMQREGDERLASSTLREYFTWMNTEDELRDNHDLMFDAGIRAADEQFGSPSTLAFWYDRNIRMAHHLWRAVEPGDERILLVVGSGHVRVLRHLLTEAPMFCPVSPLPYLSETTG